MVLTFFALTLLYVFGIFAVFYYLKMRFQQETNKQHYLKIIAQARQLFEHLPQHRGMANAFLQGDVSFKEKLTQAQNKIDQDIARLELNSESEATLAMRWVDIQSRWAEIKSTLTAFSAEESFQRHTELIVELTYFIGDAAEASKVRDSKAYFPELGEVVFNQLFLVMEFMGRARGIGTGVVSVGKMSVANRVKLGFLHQRIEKTTASSQQTLMAILSKQSDLSAQKTLVIEGQNAALEFAQLMKSELLETRHIQIKSTDYYDLGSVAIGKNLRLFDGLLPVIIRAAEQSKAKVAAQARICFVVTVITAILLAWQWAGLVW